MRNKVSKGACKMRGGEVMQKQTRIGKTNHERTTFDGENYKIGHASFELDYRKCPEER